MVRIEQLATNQHSESSPCLVKATARVSTFPNENTVLYGRNLHRWYRGLLLGIQFCVTISHETNLFGIANLIGSSQGMCKSA